MVRAPTIELMTNSLIDLPGANTLPEEARTPSWMRTSFDKQQKGTLKATIAPKADPNVLFDADDFNGEAGVDDDDFGDFETVTLPTQAASDLVSEDLLSPPVTAKKTPSELLSTLCVGMPTSPYPQAPKSPSFQQRNPFPGLSLNTPTETKQSKSGKIKESPDTAWPSFERKDSAASDDWAAFEDLPNDPKSSKSDNAKNDGWDWDSFDTIKNPSSNIAAKDSDSSWNWDPVNSTNEMPAQSKQNVEPPINVPPPSIVLSVFPQLLSQAGTSLLKPIGGQPMSVKNRILSDPKTVEFLRGSLAKGQVPVPKHVNISRWQQRHEIG